MQIQLKNIKAHVNLEVHWLLPFAYIIRKNNKSLSLTQQANIIPSQLTLE
jgi:hypothetical protein